MEASGTGPGRVFIGAARVELFLPEAGSLKGKRAVLNKAKAALTRELAVSVAEVGHLDLWQRSVLGVAVASGSETGVERVLDRLTAVLERDPRVVVTEVATDVDTPLGG